MRKKTTRNLVKQYNRYVRKLKFLLSHDARSEKIHWLKKRLRKLKLLIQDRIDSYRLLSRKITTTAAVATFLGAGVQAQDFQLKLNTGNPFYEIENEGFTKPHFVDFDGDGDEDLFVTGSIQYVSDGIKAGGLQYFENVDGVYVSSNTDAFPDDLGISELLQEDSGSIRLSMDFVDFDGDGDIDAFVNSYEGTGIAYLENVDGVMTPNAEANPFSDLMVTIDENGESDLAEVELGDINGDGGLEAILINNDSIFVQSLDEGKFVITDTIGSGFELASALMDYDGDEDLDLIIGNKYGTIDIYENTNGAFATLESHDFSTLLLETNPAPGVGDVDGDGDIDVVFGMNVGILRYFENAEDGFRYAPYNPRDIHFHGTPSPIPEFVDLDGDGDEDLLMGTFGSLTGFLENNEDVFTRNETKNPFRANSGLSLLHVDPNCGDIDGDGDIDCHFLDVFDGAEQYFENVDGTFMLADSLANPIVEFSSDENKQVVFEDFDGDGDLDLFIGNKYGDILYYENNEGIYSANQEAISDITVGTDASYLYFGDTDNDGDNDLVVINPSGALDFYMKSESGLVKMEGDDNPFSEISANIIDIDFYDLDQDGDLDILGSDFAGRAIYLENQLLQSSLEDEVYSDETRIFPNPSSGLLNIEVPWTRGQIDIQVYNINGQFVKRYTSAERMVSLDVRDLANGNYHLRIVDGDKLSIKKFAIIK